MNDLVEIQQSEKHGAVVSSRVIAKELNREHKIVIRDFEKLLKDKELESTLLSSNTNDLQGFRTEQKLQRIPFN